VGLVRRPTETDTAHAQQGGWAGRCVTKAVKQIIGAQNITFISQGTEC
jgi:hypothetical protein